MIYGAQIVALILVLFVAIEFFQYRRLRILSTKLFEEYIIFSIINIILEITCIYGVYHADIFSMKMNRFLHQLYIFTMMLLSFYIYVYIDIKCKVTKNYNAIQFSLRAIPLVLGSVFSFAIFLVYPFIIAKRIKNEEELLEKELKGYKEYKKKVKYRLIPFVW